MSRGKKRLDQQAGRTAAYCGSGEIQNRRGSFRRPLVDPPVARSFPRSANRQRRIYGLGLLVGVRCELPASTPDARSVHAVFGSPNGESPAGGGWCTVPGLDSRPVRALPRNVCRMSVLRRLPLALQRIRGREVWQGRLCRIRHGGSCSVGRGGP